ncbi:hypothetical protein PENSPDRAFT_694905 [Peniophora sp. CONT]|nr:hypothetical protein PENSPDRAFT_694905 [Peniophora sp. CONT]
MGKGFSELPEQHILSRSVLQLQWGHKVIALGTPAPFQLKELATRRGNTTQGKAREVEAVPQHQHDAAPGPIEVHDSDSDLDDDGERLPLDIHVIHDREYRLGQGPKLYAVYDGTAPGLYDKIGAMYQSMGNPGDVKIQKWNNEASAARSLRRAGISAQVPPSFLPSEIDSILAVALQDVHLTDAAIDSESSATAAGSQQDRHEAHLTIDLRGEQERVPADEHVPREHDGTLIQAQPSSRSDDSSSERSTYTLYGNPTRRHRAGGASGSARLEVPQGPPPPYEDMPPAQPALSEALGRQPPPSLLGNAQLAAPSVDPVNVSGSLGSHVASAPPSAQPPAQALVHSPAQAPAQPPIHGPAQLHVQPSPSVATGVVARAGHWAPCTHPLARPEFPVPLISLCSLQNTPYGPLSYRPEPPTSFSHRNPSPIWTPPNDYTPPMDSGPEWRGPSATYQWPGDIPDVGEEYAWTVVIRGPRVGIYRHAREFQSAIQDAWRYNIDEYGATESKRFRFYEGAVLYFRDHRAKGRAKEFFPRMPPLPVT